MKDLIALRDERAEHQTEIEQSRVEMHDFRAFAGTEMHNFRALARAEMHDLREFAAILEANGIGKGLRRDAAAAQCNTIGNILKQYWANMLNRQIPATCR